MPDDEPFALEAPPATDRQRAMADIRRQREECDRIARREKGWEEFRRRAFFVTAGWEVADVHDPAEGATLESVVALLVARVEKAATSRLGKDRWWARDFAVWRDGLLVATVRRAKGGPPVVQIYV